MNAAHHPLPNSPPTRGEHRGEAVRGMFNRIAASYDLLNDCISFGMHRNWKSRAAGKLHLSPGSQVLDVCTGTGDFVRYLLPCIGATGTFTGLDFSEEMLAIARRRFGHLPNVRFDQGDAMALPYEDNRFDGAIVGFGLRNVENVGQVLREMTRVVRPGGWVVNLDTSPEPKLPGFWMYFSLVMPLMGRLLSPDAQAYQYLFKSTQDFLPPATLVRLFGEAGLTQVHNTQLAFGSVALQAGRKPE